MPIVFLISILLMNRNKNFSEIKKFVYMTVDNNSLEVKTKLGNSTHD